MIYFKLPDDPALLVAVAKVAIRHGQLDYVLRMTVKTIERLTKDWTPPNDKALRRCASVSESSRGRSSEKGERLSFLTRCWRERGEQLNDATSFSTGCGLPSWTAKECCATTTTLGTHSQVSPSWTP
jgi:hypothetical protein